MSVGRKPKPSHLRVLDGNAGHRPLNHDEPIPVGDLEAPPHWMTEMQKDVWRAAIGKAPPGLLKRLDESIFANWVVVYCEFIEAAQKVASMGQLVKTEASPIPYKNPYLSIRERASKDLKSICAEMGFTPSSRSRVKVPKNPSTSNPFANLKQLE